MEFDGDAEERFHANSKKVASTTTLQEIQIYTKSQGVTKIRTRKKQKSSVINDSPC